MEGETAMDFTVTQLQQILSAVTGVIDVTTIVGFVAAIIGVGAAFVLMWFGIRKALSAVMGSVKKGRIGV